MVLLIAGLFSYKGDKHIQLAAVMEFLHLATLLHDDVIDESNLRRNRPTVNSKWGNSPSVLVGDFMYSRSFQMAIDIGDMRILKLLSEVTNLIIEGEIMQFTYIGNTKIDEKTYRRIIYHKTALLFQASAHATTILSGGTSASELELRDFGKNLGIAYQLVDDALDYCGDTISMGKNIGRDLSDGKLTLPIIYTISNGTKKQREVVLHAIENRDLTCFQEVVTVIQDSGALEYTLKEAKVAHSNSVACLSNQPNNHYRQALEKLADFVLQRKY